MAIIGEKLPGYVIDQIKQRQSSNLHGSGVNTEFRTDNQLNVLNSNTSWIKLASGVSITNVSRLKDIGFTQTEAEANLRLGLAKNNILFGGTAKLIDAPGRDFDRLQQRSGFLPRDANSSYTYGSYGFSPMPGIESADIKTLNRGSIKKATVKLKANNRQQFAILDLLYMRLGYTVLLEWGNSLFIDNEYGQKTVLRSTLIEDMFFKKESDGSYLDILPDIEDKRAEYSANYDGMLGKVSNFSWSFNVDGSYDIELTIISLGDVIESLKTNLSVDSGTLNFLETLGQTQSNTENPDETPPEPNVLEENRSSNMISSMLYIWKYLNNSNARGNIITIQTSLNTHKPGSFLVPTSRDQSSNLTATNKTYTFTISGKSGLATKQLQNLEKQQGLKLERTFNFSSEQLDSGIIPKTINDIKKEYKDKGFDTTLYDTSYIKISYSFVDSDSSTIDNPISSAGSKDAIRLNSKPRQFYLRFGYLLEYIKDNILPRIKIGNSHAKNPQIFDIDTNEWESHMYSLPNQISLDPRVCIVGNRNFNSGQGNTQVFPELPFFREIDNGESKNPNAAYPLNIYLNFEFILECLKADDRGDVNIFEFISSICTGLNKALGGINNLEPIIDENTNTLSIIDTTPIPGYSSKSTKSYTLQIYGYKTTKNDYISNFVRNVDLKTTISPEYATMITVGATAGGYVKGTEATAFSKWNVGLRDRFKEDFTPGNLSSVKKANEVDEAEVNYATEFLKKGYKTRYGLTDLEGNFSLNTDAIERNLSVVTEYYKYLIAKESIDQDTSGGTIGFIPFKLNLTLDGISGIKIYNKLQVNTEFLPKVYSKTVDLIVTGVSHNLSNNDWTTQIETTVIPKTGKLSTVQIDTTAIQESFNRAAPVPSSKSLKEVLISAGYKEGTFVFELALAIGSKEGYKKGSTNRPSRNNNPGNLDGSNYKDIDPGVTLEPKNSKGESRFAKFTTPELGAKALVERKIKSWARGNYPRTKVNGSSSESNTYRTTWNVPNSLKGIAGKKVELTIEQFFFIYAPPSENNTIGYINSVVSSLKKNYPEVTKLSKIRDYLNK